MTKSNSAPLSFEGILKMLDGRSVIATNLYPAPPYPQPILSDGPYKLELGSTSFYVHRGPNEAQLTFNEAQESTADFTGDRLTMEDAQGFMFDLDLEPRLKMSANGAPDKEMKILKAVKLLTEAVDLLSSAGAAGALKRSRLALASTEDAARRIAERKARPKRESQPALRVMPSDRSALIREDGTLRYVSYLKPSGHRPAVVAISFRVPGLTALTTTFSLDGRDLSVVYEAAVSALAKHCGVDGNIDLVNEMLATREPFLQRYRI